MTRRYLGTTERARIAEAYDIALETITNTATVCPPSRLSDIPPLTPRQAVNLWYAAAVRGKRLRDASPARVAAKPLLPIPAEPMPTWGET